ncbi:hypothetical protein BKA62DRAFT_643487 [Auriculariales sp. MPI-PUGE-AT-0066]|nr:hypothetical protein BKA62DRAFT_643487 [Auriculariales sp. MPI-PUGE-AT-0066]
MFKIIVLTQTLFGLALAGNDWSKACLNGKCSYEGGDGVNSAWSTLDLKASPSTLSDITPAAGWTITGCKSTWASGVAHIQLKCEGSAQQTANCNHLFDGGAAANKVVRLTEACGVGAFARVINATETSLDSYDVSLDYDFSQIPSDGTRSLSFSVTASNVKGGTSGTSLRARHSIPQRRYPVALTRRFDVDKTFDLPPLKVNKAFNLLNRTFDCPAAAGGVGLTASLDVSADVAVNIQSAFGISLEGRILPFPKVTSFSLTATATGDAGATFDALASVTGTFTTGDITLFQAGLPGLNVPGIINIGPQFVLNSRLDASLGLQANVRAGATYTIPQVSLVFPPSAGKSIATIKPVPDALGLQLEPGATADATVIAHLVPRLEFGIEVLKGLAEAEIFLNVDGSAKLSAQAEASADISVGDTTDTTVNGCVGLDAGVAVTAGATGSIPGIFSKTKSFDLFRKNFNLFERCFGDLAKRSYRVPPSLGTRLVPSQMSKQLSPRALSCPSPGSGGLLENVLDLVASK